MSTKELYTFKKIQETNGEYLELHIISVNRETLKALFHMTIVIVVIHDCD
jgi:hypothetical protein